MPPVRDELDPSLRDPIDVVKAALDGVPAPKKPAEPPAAGGGGPPRRPLAGLSINWRWVRRGAVVAAVLLLLLPFVTFAMAYSIVDVPKPGDIRTAQVSTILASDGSEIAKIVPPEGNRIDVGIDQIPEHVRDAVMAAEDRDFYSNPGFSFTGFARAIKNNIVGGDTQGGSTITQQYVKNALVGDARSGFGGLVRKAKELVISTKMSREWSKDEVLEAYLNIIYFGRGAYGISAASRAYFDKPVEDLTVSEGALLAALIQRPSTLDPAVDLEGAQERWNWVLDGMVTIGALSEQDRAAQVFPETIAPERASQANQTTGPNGLIERQVIKELMGIFNI
ncbi:MAG TPA: biosynthetic peptidoglycan transglycosylase, partial [Mycolicibacterium fallax]|nr:biosynthetic peptidoglycan transglycosylase [Mycolicibacterium fallax]